jgi:AbrB family looped-hinge helix DNA binding protein
MSYTISMDKAGRIVIPKEIRERIGANETTRFDLDIVLDRIELTPKEDPGRSKSRVIEKDGVWVVTGTGKKFSAAEVIRQDREDRMEFLAHPESR